MSPTMTPGRHKSGGDAFDVYPGAVLSVGEPGNGNAQTCRTTATSFCWWSSVRDCGCPGGRSRCPSWPRPSRNRAGKPLWGKRRQRHHEMYGYLNQWLACHRCCSPTPWAAAHLSGPQVSGRCLGATSATQRVAAGAGSQCSLPIGESATCYGSGLGATANSSPSNPATRRRSIECRLVRTARRESSAASVW